MALLAGGIIDHHDLLYIKSRKNRTHNMSDFLHQPVFRSPAAIPFIVSSTSLNSSS
ncbi:hypothetical protein QFZ72_002355 [Bacillus sp. V2I10]|nr:hypothetical protein [Bacillus sp. V2I10]